MGKFYLCIDLKSFFASVECVERGLDPFKAPLVVADPDRGRGAVCLAVSPALKAQGIPGRCRLFEIPKRLKYIIAKPRMRLYLEKSDQIRAIYHRYVSEEDIHVYSVDECFIDITDYLRLYGKSEREFAHMLMDAVLKETGISAAAGIGTNMFLAKTALDVCAKKAPDRMGYLDETEFKKSLWHYRPITDIWNIGSGIAHRLESMGVYDLYGITRLPPDALYREFGVNAEYIIDHAWGRESCTVSEIKNYVPQGHSISNAQTLFSDYTYDDARLVMHEMVDMIVLDLVRAGMTAGSISLYVVYSKASLGYAGSSLKLCMPTYSARRLIREFDKIYSSEICESNTIRRIGIALGDLADEKDRQISIFDDVSREEKEHTLLRTVAELHDKYGSNIMVKARDFEKCATLRIRNELIGGHNAC